MAGKVVIGCKLPNGLTLVHPTHKHVRVALAGLNSARIIGATHVTTEVDQEFWDDFKAAHKDYAPLKSGSIFEARNETEAQAKGKELKKQKTGFEQVQPDSAGVTTDKGK